MPPSVPSNETQLALLVAGQDAANEKLDRLIACVDGSGPEDPGMKIRLDRLEQSEKNRKWAIRTLMGAVATLFSKWAYEALTRRH